MTTLPQVWFITGASSGFGRAMTELLLKKGVKVVATLRKPEVINDLVQQYTSEQLLVVKLDVTQPPQVADAFAKAKEAFGRIDVVFNNAVARSLFETNFWGALNVSTEAVKFFRDVNQPQGGRLLQVSSAVGIVGAAGIGFYCASKFALEGLSESLALELDPKWNIKITIVAPGPFHTDALSNVSAEPVHPAYTDESLGSAQQRLFVSKNEQDGDSRKAVAVLEKLSHLENPPLRFSIHKLSIYVARIKGERVQKEADEYEAWSEDVYL
ncbi:hypothetical protein F5I97DRAFT_1929545 [Phlebopus sp. FC_14]|nr:hypothetical protein F5I97DRAFT_1929545 [Phlebopus sp. FC_14]